MPAYRCSLVAVGFCLGLFVQWSVAAAPVPLPAPHLVGFLREAEQRLAVVEMPGSRSPLSAILAEGDFFESISLTVIDPVGGIVRFRKQGSADQQEWKLPSVGAGANSLFLQDAELNTAIEAYQRLARRTVLRGPVLPRTRINLSASTSLEDLLGALQSTLATNGVTIRPAGELFAFAVRNDQANVLASLPPAPITTTGGRDSRLRKFTLYFQQADQSQVLELYQELTGRTVLRGPNISGRSYTFRNETELTRAEGVWLMESLFRLHGLGVWPQGTNLVVVALASRTNGLPSLESKPVPRNDAPMKGATFQFSEADPQQLLELYAALSGSTAGSVSPPVSSLRVSLRNQGPLTRREAIYALETLAALYGMGFRLEDGRVDLVPLNELREK